METWMNVQRFPWSHWRMAYSTPSFECNSNDSELTSQQMLCLLGDLKKHAEASSVSIVKALYKKVFQVSLSYLLPRGLSECAETSTMSAKNSPFKCNSTDWYSSVSWQMFCLHGDLNKCAEASLVLPWNGPFKTIFWVQLC